MTIAGIDTVFPASSFLVENNGSFAGDRVVFGTGGITIGGVAFSHGRLLELVDTASNALTSASLPFNTSLAPYNFERILFFRPNNAGDLRGQLTSLSFAQVSTFSITHQYLDDNPSGTPADKYTVTGTLSDDDGGSVPLGGSGVSKFYWSQSTSWTAPGTGGAVFSANEDGSNRVQLAAGFNRIDDVEVDTLNGRLFWNNWASGQVNNNTEGIYRSALDGSGQVKITDVAESNSSAAAASGMHGIALDPVNGIVYFTRGVSYADNNGGPEVSKVSMDGTGYTRLNANDDGWFLSGIDIDTATNALFWGSPGVLNTGNGGAVNRMNLDGTNKQYNRVPHTNGLGRAIALDADHGLVFFSSWSIQTPTQGGGIWVLNLANNAVTQILNDPNTGIPDLELDSENMRLYWTDFVRGEIRSASYNPTGGLSGIGTEVTGISNAYGLALETVAPLTIEVRNVLPTFEAGPNETLNPPVAGAFSRGPTSFSDPGTLDTWTGTVNYGDGVVPIIQPLLINPGDKTYSLSHTYVTQGTFPVTVTLRDDDGQPVVDTFQVTVILNQPPSIAVDDADVSTPEGTAASNLGTFSDPQGINTVTLSASVGTVIPNYSLGTWSWSNSTSDGPAGPFPVTITATDIFGATASVNFSYTVNNVAPTVTLSGSSRRERRADPELQLHDQRSGSGYLQHRGNIRRLGGHHFKRRLQLGHGNREL